METKRDRCFYAKGNGKISNHHGYDYCSGPLEVLLINQTKFSASKQFSLTFGKADCRGRIFFLHLVGEFPTLLETNVRLERGLISATYIRHFGLTSVSV